MAAPGTRERFQNRRIAIDAVVDMQNELRRCARDSFAMRHVIERALQFAVLLDVLPDLRKTSCRWT